MDKICTEKMRRMRLELSSMMGVLNLIEISLILNPPPKWQLPEDTFTGRIINLDEMNLKKWRVVLNTTREQEELEVIATSQLEAMKSHKVIKKKREMMDRIGKDALVVTEAYEVFEEN
ncbi:MAG: hypothetical protein NW226_17675 [Microscillaceae bacterium]|nr:hypothetical protein [Microscillaceae bacterium]